jgi:uncharacterized membrane-anchored protein YhcB (DUF1043 family)
MRKVIIFTGLMAILLVPMVAVAVENAPRITDREIVERLTRLEEGQKALNERIDDVNKRMDDFRAEMNGRFEAMDKRFDTLQWMLGLFITISLVIFGFVLRMQWQMQRRQTVLEATLNAHKDELAFLKNLIERLLSPKGVL